MVKTITRQRAFALGLSVFLAGSTAAMAQDNTEPMEGDSLDWLADVEETAPAEVEAETTESTAPAET